MEDDAVKLRLNFAGRIKHCWYTKKLGKIKIDKKLYTYLMVKAKVAYC